MHDSITETSTITRELVPEDQRLTVTADLFGVHFPLQIEPTTYTWADHLSTEYNGGFWDFYRLSNSGFYLAPDSDLVYTVICDNGFVGQLSGDSIGIVACLYAYSHLSFSRNEDFARVCDRHYYWLREFMFDHAEVAAILGATD